MSASPLLHLSCHFTISPETLEGARLSAPPSGSSGRLLCTSLYLKNAAQCLALYRIKNYYLNEMYELMSSHSPPYILGNLICESLGNFLRVFS